MSLKKGMDTGRKSENIFGFSELHKAVIKNDGDTIRRLVSDGVDKTIKDSANFTAEELAIILRKDWLFPYLQGEAEVYKKYRQKIFSSDYYNKVNGLNNVEQRKDGIKINNNHNDITNTRSSNTANDILNKENSFSYRELYIRESASFECSNQENFAPLVKNSHQSYTRKTPDEIKHCGNSSDVFNDLADSAYSTLKSTADDDETQHSPDLMSLSDAILSSDLKRLTKSSFDKAHHSNGYKQFFDASILSENHDLPLVTNDQNFNNFLVKQTVYDESLTKKDCSSEKESKPNRLYRSRSYPDFFGHHVFAQNMSEQNEDWEVWDFEQTLDKSNDDSVKDDIECNSDEREESWAENSNRSSFTSSYRMDGTGDSEEKSIYVFSAKSRSLSESCDDRVKSVNLSKHSNSRELLDVSSEEPRGFTRSLSATIYEKKKSKSFLSLPFLKKSSSGNSLNLSPAKNYQHRSFTDFSFSNSNKKSSASPKLTKKSSSFTSLFRRKKSIEETTSSNPTNQTERQTSENAKNEEKVLTITVPTIQASPKTEKTVRRSSQRENENIGEVSTTSAKKYSITFTPENTSEKKPVHQSPQKNDIKNPTAQKALIPLVIGVGLGSEESSSNVIKNTLKPHSVTETGYFTLSQKTDTDFTEVNIESAVKESEDRITSDVTNNNNFINDTRSNSKVVKKDEKQLNEQDVDMDDFQVVLDTNYDYPKFSTPIKKLNNDKEESNTEDGGQNEIVASEEHVPLDECGNPEDVFDSKENESDQSDFGMRLGKSNGQLPKYEELYSTSFDTNEHSNNTPDKDVHHSIINNTQNRQRFISTSNCDDVDCGDSITSFEQHEREYVMLSQNGLLSPLKSAVDEPSSGHCEEMGANDEYADMYDDEVERESYEDEDDDDVIPRNGLEERRMTMELLNYMPPILERSTEITTDDLSTAEENRPVSQGSEEVCPLRLSTENLRLHDEELQKKGSGDNLLQGFVNVVLVNESESEVMNEHDQITKSRGLISQASSRRIQRQLNFEDPESCNSLRVNHSETSAEDVAENPSSDKNDLKNNVENNETLEDSTEDHKIINKSFEIPLEISTHSLQHTTPKKSTESHGPNELHTETQQSESINNMNLKDTEDSDRPEHYENKGLDLEERKKFQKKCLWYDYSADTTDGNMTSRTSSDGSHDVDDVTTLVKKSEDFIATDSTDYQKKRMQPGISLQRDPSLTWDGLVLEYDENLYLSNSNQRPLDDIPEISDDAVVIEGGMEQKSEEKTNLREELYEENYNNYSSEDVSILVNEKSDPKILRITPTIDHGFSDVETQPESRDESVEVTFNENMRDSSSPRHMINNEVEPELDILRFDSTWERIKIDSTSIKEPIKDKNEYKVSNQDTCDTNTFINIPNANFTELSLHDDVNTPKRRHVTKSKKVKEDRLRPVKLSHNPINLNEILKNLSPDGKTKNKKKGKLSIRSVPAKTFSKPSKDAESLKNLDDDDVDTSVATLVYGGNRSNKLRPQSTEDYTVISFDDGTANQCTENHAQKEKFDSNMSSLKKEENSNNMNKTHCDKSASRDQNSDNDKVVENDVFHSVTAKEEETSAHATSQDISICENVDSTDKVKSSGTWDVSSPIHSPAKSITPTEEDRDSGLSEDFNDDVDSFNQWFRGVQPKLYDAYFVACFFVELSEKYSEKKNDTNKNTMQMAQCIYKETTEKNTCDFKEVLSYLLYFIGYHVEPRFHSDVPKYTMSILLDFLKTFVEKTSLSLTHLDVLLENITQPNTRMIEYHDKRLSLINVCFEKYMKSLKSQENNDEYLLQCFCRINDCYAYFDNDALPRKVCDYLIPYITKENDARFSLSILEKLGFMQHENHGKISHEIPGSLLVLREVFLNSNMTKTSRSLLQTYMEKQSREFQFCQKERSQLVTVFR